MEKQDELIYIAGYGRSGSTLLERLLQFQPLIHAGGELVNFFDLFPLGHSLCSCGQKLYQCPFWSRVAKELNADGYPVENYAHYAKIQKKSEALWTHGGSIISSRTNRTYSSLLNSFLTAVFSQIKPRKILIDSSKTAYANAYRPSAIHNLGNRRVRVMHMVRDPRGVVWSVHKGLNRKLEAGHEERVVLPALRASLGWAFANLAANRLKTILGHDNYHLVRYEDLAADPSGTLTSLESFLEMDLGESIKAVQSASKGEKVQMQATHQLAGNRMRFNTALTISPDFAWGKKLSPGKKYLVKKILSPLMKKYGYVD